VRALVVLLLCVVGCDRGSTVTAEGVSTGEPALRPVLSGHTAARIANLEARGRTLGAEWVHVERGYDRAEQTYEGAMKAYQRAQAESAAASEQFIRAAATFHDAERQWRFYQTLVTVAAAIDASNLDAFRRATGMKDVPNLDCSAGMSTARFRELLVSSGVSVLGQDVDHIVPRSLGGADHAANYQLLPSSVNRSLGNAWDREKCLGAANQCAGAVAISRKCGTFKGPAF
jgi:hypothetical protein